MKWWDRVSGGQWGSRRARYERRLTAINALEPSLKNLSDEQLAARGVELRARARDGAPLDDLLEESFAVTREAAWRTLGMRHFDVQLIGGMALHDGCFAEMKTGEGKTLVATLPACLNGFTGAGVHIVTVNDYLAERDAAWMGPLYSFLGLSVGVILEQMGADDAEDGRNRKAAYGSDITYGTNHEIAFDFLRDNLAVESEEIVHRGFHYAIVDEVDFLLVDEARTPLIISGTGEEDTDHFRRVDAVVRHMQEGVHYVVDPRTRTASLTEVGFEIASRQLGVENLSDLAHLDLYHAVYQSVLAHGAYHYDVDYIVEDDEVLIVDEFTGRVSEDKRYAAGLHQAIEAKERVPVRAEDLTLAKITYQTFYGRYHKLSGMTGTAWSERQEFAQTYGRRVHRVPTHRPLIRGDYRDRIFFSMADKHSAVVTEIQKRIVAGQPVLVGTTSVRESEQISGRLNKQGVPHAVLNAKNHRAEAAVVAQAGRQGAVTISTNMAGRGTDIILGGNPKYLAQDAEPRATNLEVLRRQCAAEREAVVAAGGLHVIGTAHHESVRIDDQLRGRSGRQGDPGSSQFFVSLDDAIWKRFGQAVITRFKDQLKSDHTPGAPLGDSRVVRTLRQLQKKVDFENQAIRRDVLKYDLVVHVQRETIYGWRQSLVTGEGYEPTAVVRELVDDLVTSIPDGPALAGALEAHFHRTDGLGDPGAPQFVGSCEEWALSCLADKQSAVGADAFDDLGRLLLLESIDALWTEHLSNLERVEDGIGLRGYGGVDPIIEFRREALQMWLETLHLIRSRAVSLWFLVEMD